LVLSLDCLTVSEVLHVVNKPVGSVACIVAQHCVHAGGISSTLVLAAGTGATQQQHAPSMDNCVHAGNIACMIEIVLAANTV
jgi:hypothetical protein